MIIDEPYQVFEDLLDFLAINWQTAELVHADFSEYNILWKDGEPWVIDVGQSVTKQHPHSEEFLVRDVTRLVQWINRQGYNADIGESLASSIRRPSSYITSTIWTKLKQELKPSGSSPNHGTFSTDS